MCVCVVFFVQAMTAMNTRHYDKTFATSCNVHEASLHQPLPIAAGAIVVRDSRILGARLGVFSTQHISGNRVIGEYTGTIRKAALCDPSWAMYTSRGLDFMIDASTSRRTCLVRFINDAPPARANCISRELYADGRVFLISKAAIPPGVELLYDYGPDYNRTWLLEA
jgi:hypothetical protein